MITRQRNVKFSLCLQDFRKSLCKVKFQKMTNQVFTWPFETWYAHARDNSMNLTKRCWIIIFPSSKVQSTGSKLTQWKYVNLVHEFKVSRGQIMSTFHRWSCFLIKESTWIRCRDHGVHWAECKTKKKKWKKKKKAMSYLALSKSM